MPRLRSQNGTWAELKKYCKPIRLTVFVTEQGVPSSIELDTLDEHSHHFVIFNEHQKPVATARLMSNGKFGRMAVLKNHRGQDIGNELLRLISQQARHLKLEQLICHAQLSAEGFYANNGFSRIGEPVEEAGIAHIRMVKRLNAAEGTLQ